MLIEGSWNDYNLGIKILLLQVNHGNKVIKIIDTIYIRNSPIIILKTRVKFQLPQSCDSNDTTA